jgi:citrate synthase
MKKRNVSAVCKTMGKFLMQLGHIEKYGYPLNYYDNTKGYVEKLMELMLKLPTELI